MKVLRLCT